MKRSYWHSSWLEPGYDRNTEEVRLPVQKEDANLISSLVEGDTWGPTDEGSIHMPALDIDLKCHLRESETPGHYHLLIDRPMTWAQYQKLLNVMAEVGILEPGYVKASIERGSTFLALQPWKEASAEPAR